MARKVSLARAVKVTVPTGKSVTQGTFALISGYFGLALQDAAEGEQVVLEIERAVYETTQINTADAFNLGDAVYWDDAAGLLTTSNGAGANRLVGRVWRAKDASNSIEFVLTGGA